MVYVPATRIKVVKPFVCRGELVPAGAYLSPAMVVAVQRKLNVMLSEGTLDAVPDTYERTPVSEGITKPTYLNPDVVKALATGTLEANFTFTPTVLSVAFDGSTSSGTRPRVDWKWDFGDGSAVVTEQDANAVHVYTAPGTYPVGLRVVDNLGRYSFSDVQAVTVAGALTAAFTGTPTVKSVAFNASASTATGDIVGYEWDYGDGSAVVTKPTASHTYVYATAATFTVSLVIVDEWGERSTAVTHQVTTT